MPRITMQVHDCTPEEARMIAAYIDAMCDRTADVERTAQAMAAPQPPVAVVPQPPVAVVPQPPVAVVPAYTPPPAPVSLSAAPQPPVARGELDARGVPWHTDHHASTKGVNIDGSWKKKKGGDKNATSTYELQFTGRPVSPPQPPVAVAPQAPAYTPPPAPASPPVPTADELTAKFAPPPAPNGAVPMPSYAEFYGVYMQLCEQGRVTAADFENVHKIAGVSSPAEYISDEPKRMLAYLEFQKLAA